MGMFNFVLDSIKGEIFDFKVKRRVFVASTVHPLNHRFNLLQAINKRKLNLYTSLIQEHFILFI